MKKEINLSDILEEMCLTGQTRLTPVEACRLAEKLRHEAMHAVSKSDFQERMDIYHRHNETRWGVDKIGPLSLLRISRRIEGEFLIESTIFLTRPELQKLQEDLANLQSELETE